jgi:hypothetical protein
MPKIGDGKFSLQLSFTIYDWGSSHFFFSMHWAQGNHRTMAFTPHPVSNRHLNVALSLWEPHGHLLSVLEDSVMNPLGLGHSQAGEAATTYPM